MGCISESLHLIACEQLRSNWQKKGTFVKFRVQFLEDHASHLIIQKHWIEWMNLCLCTSATLPATPHWRVVEKRSAVADVFLSQVTTGLLWPNSYEHASRSYPSVWTAV